MNIKQIICYVFIMLLCACATSPYTEKGYRQISNKWIGISSDTLQKEMGVPNKTSILSNNGLIFEYVNIGSTYIMIDSYYTNNYGFANKLTDRNPTLTVINAYISKCTTDYLVDSNFMIFDVSFRGHCVAPQDVDSYVRYQNFCKKAIIETYSYYDWWNSVWRQGKGYDDLDKDYGEDK